MTYCIRIKDYSDENSTFTASTDPVTPPTAAEMTALFTAVDSLSIGTLGDGILKSETVNDAGSVALPANAFAQRELKYVVSFSSNVSGKQYSREIPCADASLLSAGSDLLDLANATVAAFVTAFEALYRVQEGTAYNAVTITSIRLVGRNT